MNHQGRRFQQFPEENHELMKKYTEVVQFMPVGLMLYHLEDLEDDHTLRMIAINPAATEITGIDSQDVIGKTLDENFPGLREMGIPQQYAEVVRTQKPIVIKEINYGDDRVKSAVFSVKAFPLPDQCVGVVFENITERKQAEKELAETKGVLEQAIAQSPSGILIADAPNVSIRLGNEAAFNIRKGDRAILTGIEVAQHTENWQTLKPNGSPYPPEQLPLSRAVLQGEVTQGEEVIIRDAKGNDHWVSTNAAPIFDTQGKITAGIVVFHDITEHKQAEERLLASEERYRTYVNNAPYGVFVANEHGRYIDVNPAACQITGYNEPELLERSTHDITPEEGRKEGAKHFQTVAQVGHAQSVLPFTHKSGEKRWWNVSAVKLSESRFLGFTQDITQRKQEEEERENLQAQLHQAQKMESVGRLAGGIAHDFNNMLSVMQGHVEMALEEVDPNQSLFVHLKEAYKATERSADLTRQLLAFARRQIVAPKMIDLNKTIEGMLKMMRRLIGEDIDLVWKPAKELGLVLMDKSQIDQILANLCVNARDAIADVGKVTIATNTAAFDEEYCTHHPGFTPGEYVLLSVSDDGKGMNKETLTNLFEPFFTTKSLGDGTGLGLATVYGIVKQNKGFIDVHSEPGTGTSFRIYLPRHVGKAEQIFKTEDSKKSGEAGKETILLVEDEPAILDIATIMLERQGYSILSAKTPSEAIYVAKQHAGRIDLLITDVIMPEMNGRELARNIISLYPDIKSLFMSGYTADVIAHHGVLDQGVHFVQKPFSKNILTTKVKEALEQKE